MSRVMPRMRFSASTLAGEVSFAINRSGESCYAAVRSVLPDFEKGVADDDSPRRQLAQQLCHGLGSLTVSRDNYGPFQVLPKFAGDDAPLIERARLSRSDLNERPVSNQRKRDFAVRQWAVNNEMVVAMYQNPYHDKVTLVRSAEIVECGRSGTVREQCGGSSVYASHTQV